MLSAGRRGCRNEVFRYTDTEGVNLRWGKHPHAGDYIYVSGLEHYHPSPNAGSGLDEVEASCITISRRTGHPGDSQTPAGRLPHGLV